MYLTLHSYGQYFLIPWGYDVAYPADYNDMKALAQKAASKFRRYRYTVGNSADLLYPAAGKLCIWNAKILLLVHKLIVNTVEHLGGSDDWAKSIGVRYSYTIELADTGNYGFILPANQIMPVCEDFFLAMQVFADKLSLRAG